MSDEIYSNVYLNEFRDENGEEEEGRPGGAESPQEVARPQEEDPQKSNEIYHSFANNNDNQTYDQDDFEVQSPVMSGQPQKVVESEMSPEKELKPQNSGNLNELVEKEEDYEQDFTDDENVQVGVE